MTSKSSRGSRESAATKHVPGCIVKALPGRLSLRAAQTAARINPVNAPVFGPQGAMTSSFQVLEPQHIALLTSKYWGPSPRQLSVSFMESTPNDLKARIISHMNAWGKTACITFAETASTGQVRISRESGGYWSYLGTDILYIPTNQQTMNLEGFTMGTPESEFHRVIRHETGHTLGFPHEHMRQDVVSRINPEKAYEWFWQFQGWDRAMVDAQVLTSLDENSLMGTPADVTSIMCYQLPGDITWDGEPIPGGLDIDESDYAFAGTIYPRPSTGSNGSFNGETNGQPVSTETDDWPESEDVTVDVNAYV